MSVVPLGTLVVHKSYPAFSAPGDKPEITPAVLPTFILSAQLGKLPLPEKRSDIPRPYSRPYLSALVRHQVSVRFSLLCRLLENL
jgi:hypothetical protein